MKNYKLIDVLKTFTRKELRNFGEFVSSPFYNKNKNVINLYKTLVRYYPEFNSKNFTTETVFKKVFPADKFNYHKINNVVSDLYSLSEKYLVVLSMNKRDMYEAKFLIYELRLRKLYKLYKHKFYAYMKELINREIKDENYFYNMYELNDDYLWYATIKKPNTELNILQNEFDNFFNYVLIRLSRFYSLMLHERNQNNVDYRLTMFNEVMSFLNNNEFDEIPVLSIFSNIVKLLHTKEQKYYDKLKDLKTRYFYKLNIEDRRLLFIHLYDYCAYMVNFKGDDRFYKDMFEIYREMLEKKFMTKESFLFPDFINVVKIACRVGEYKWAELFIEDYKSSIPAEEKQNVLEFCNGTIAYARGDLERALLHYSKSNFQNFIFRVQVKILLLKIYYKLGRYEEAFGIIDTFRHYLSREKNLLQEHRDSYRIFLKLMSDLIKEKEKPNKNQREFNMKKIKEETAAMPANPFRIKTWLLEELR